MKTLKHSFLVKEEKEESEAQDKNKKRFDNQRIKDTIKTLVFHYMK
jgi:hypothetical protein